MEKVSKFKFRINKIYYFLFRERFNKKIDFNFPEDKNRLDFIQKIIDKKNFNSYLEIGCDDDFLFSKVKVKKKIGVDPVSGGNFKGTSDKFFNQNKDFFDCVFIDGLHEYNQVYKDIINAITYLNDDGVIILHDCLPSSIHQQAVPRYKSGWTGDVWKAIVNIRTRPEYDTVTCNIDCGISIIRKRKNQDILDIKINNFKKLKFEDFYKNYKKYMRVMDYNKTFDYLDQS
mgnify:CR=1 FL=1|jgi:hypothetical protein|tara:strand:- start:151 stop:840 length:690 start_codon:yes stop_codon:yes gene_type:complete